MSISYRGKYFKIYVWQGLSIILGFLSLFIVMPSLSSNKTLFGIYSVCTSLTIFFSYADLGFISSGLKYAAEYYIRGDRKNEVRTIGFTAFIMLSMFMVIALLLAFISIFPKVLIPELELNSENFYTARYLLMLLAISCPIIIGQRILNMIYSIRVEDYKLQRISAVGSILKILSVFLFFSNERYLLVPYFAFVQFVNLFVVLIASFQVRKYQYSFGGFLKAIRFDRSIFDKEKRLTGASLISMVSWVLFYEFDQIAISNFVGLEAVAVYSVAFSALTFVRTFMSLLYSPYSSRYNHLIGEHNRTGLMNFVNRMLLMFSPMVILPIVGLCLLGEPFIISWVGPNYEESGNILSLLVFCFLPCFISNPSSSYFVATEKASLLNRFNIFQPMLYWILILLTVGKWGVYSFAILKGMIPILFGFFYWYSLNRDFAKNGGRMISLFQLGKTLVVPLIVILSLSVFIKPYMAYEYSKLSLCYNLLIMGLVITSSILTSVFCNKEMMSFAKSVLKR